MKNSNEVNEPHLPDGYPKMGGGFKNQILDFELETWHGGRPSKGLSKQVKVFLKLTPIYDQNCQFSHFSGNQNFQKNSILSIFHPQNLN